MLYLGLEKIGRVSSLLLEYVFQSKTVTPTESEQVISADSDYNGLSEVTVKAISSTYVGSGVTRQAGKTIIPSSSEQIAVEAGVYTTGQIKVAAAPGGIDTSDATATADDISKDKTAYVNGEKIVGNIHEITGTLAYTDDSFNIPVSTQWGDICVSLKFLSPKLYRRNSTIELVVSKTKFGDATAENVAAGSTFTSSAGLQVAGTMVVQHYYTGEDEPDSSLGNDGDLYLRL